MVHKLYNFLSLPFVSIRNHFYDFGIIKQIKSNIPIISVGNISFGGTGKTPFIIYLAEKFNKLGIKSLLLSRGYKSFQRDFGVLMNLNSSKDLYNFGDEACLVQSKTKIPIVVSKKKYKAIHQIENNFNIDVVILDDGFQHRKLYRNLDIVLIDANTFRTFHREPLSNIKRANIILLENGLEPTRLPSGSFHIYFFRKIINSFENSSNVKVELNSLCGQKVALLSAIGNNNNFYQSLKPLIPDIIKHFKFCDHHWYKKEEIEKICKQLYNNNIYIIITTEKDFIKLKRFNPIFEKFNINLIRAIIEFKICEEEDFLDTVLEYINLK